MMARGAERRQMPRGEAKSEPASPIKALLHRMRATRATTLETVAFFIYR
jgi:hypothetical protein